MTKLSPPSHPLEASEASFAQPPHPFRFTIEAPCRSYAQAVNLNHIYLPPERSALPWQLDAGSIAMRQLARVGATITEATTCDSRSVLHDLDVLENLLRSRHFGVATELVDAVDAVASIEAATVRIQRTQPTTFGEAWGELCDEIRLALKDRHVHIQGSGRSQIRPDVPASSDTNGPVVQAVEIDGILVIRLRRLFGDRNDERLLKQWLSHAPEHFKHSRIVVDLRGNPGGNDGYVLEWAARATQGVDSFPSTERAWVVDETPPNLWNQYAILQATTTAASIPQWMIDSAIEPSPSSREVLLAPASGAVPAGDLAWNGRMLVVVDGKTGSSGESSAWLLKHLLGATIIGQRTYGSIEYGNMCPYLLPATGAMIQLPTKHNDFGSPVEIVGFPVDLEMDPTTPLADICTRFDTLLRG